MVYSLPYSSHEVCRKNSIKQDATAVRCQVNQRRAEQGEGSQEQVQTQWHLLSEIQSSGELRGTIWGYGNTNTKNKFRLERKLWHKGESLKETKADVQSD